MTRWKPSLNTTSIFLLYSLTGKIKLGPTGSSVTWLRPSLSTDTSHLGSLVVVSSWDQWIQCLYHFSLCFKKDYFLWLQGITPLILQKRKTVYNGNWKINMVLKAHTTEEISIRCKNLKKKNWFLKNIFQRKELQTRSLCSCYRWAATVWRSYRFRVCNWHLISLGESPQIFDPSSTWCCPLDFKTVWTCEFRMSLWFLVLKM